VSDDAPSRAGHDLDLDKLLAFEQRWAGRAGNREGDIRATFGCSSARYYQALYAVLDTAEALQADPMLVRRLQRLRDERRAARGGLPSRDATV
jgi:hypothetical protein